MITMTVIPKDSALQWFIPVATTCARASNVDDSIWLVLSNSSPFINSTELRQIAVVEYIFPSKSDLVLPSADNVSSIIQRNRAWLSSMPTNFGLVETEDCCFLLTFFELAPF